MATLRTETDIRRSADLKSRGSALLNALSLAVAVLAIAMAALSWYRLAQAAFTLEGGDRPLIAAVLLFSAALIAQIVMRRGHAQAAGRFFCGVLWMACAIYLAKTGLHAASVAYFMFVVFSAGLIVSWRAGLLAAVLSFGYAAAAAFLALRGVFPQAQAPASPLESWLPIAVLLPFAVVYWRNVRSGRAGSALPAESIASEPPRPKTAPVTGPGRWDNGLVLAIQIGQVLADQTGGVEATLQQAVELILESFDLAAARIFLEGRSTGDLELRAQALVPAELPEAAEAAQHPDPIVAQSALTRETIVLEDPANTDGPPQIAIPMISADRLVGVLNLASDRPAAFRAENRPALEVMAGQVGMAIEKAIRSAEKPEEPAPSHPGGKRGRPGWDPYLEGVRPGDQIGYSVSRSGLQPIRELPVPEPGMAQQIPITLSGQSIGTIQVEGSGSQLVSLTQRQFVAEVSKRVARRIQHLRLVDEVERYRTRADQAMRQLTREGWEEYLQAKPDSALPAFEYHLATDSIRASIPASPAAALAHPIRVNRETVGQLQVDLPAETSDRHRELVQAVSDQLSKQIEKLRMSEQTARALVATEDQARRLAMMNEMAAQLGAAQSRAEIYKIAARSARKIIGADQTTLALLDDSRDRLQLFRLDGTQGAVSSGLQVPLEGTAMGEVVHSRSVLLLGELASDRYLDQSALAEQGIGSALLAPLIASDRVIGTLNLGSLNVDHFAERDSNLVLQIASLLASTIEARELFAETQRRAAELKKTSVFLDSIVENLPVMLYIKDAETLQFVRFNRAGEELTGLREADLLGKCDHDILPADEAARRVQRDREILAGDQSVEVSEELIESERLGLRWLQTRKVPIRGNDGQAKYLLVISEDITERKRTAESLAKRAAELQTVAQMSTATSTILESQHLLQAVVDLTKERFDLYHVHIYLENDPGGEFVLAAGAGEVGKAMVGEHQVISQDQPRSLIAQAARTRQAIVLNDTSQQTDFLPHPLLPATRSELAIPMIIGDRVIGVFDVLADSPGRFAEEDVAVQTTLAAQVAVALQNAQLYQQTKRRARRERLIFDISQKIRTTVSVQDALQTAVRELGRALEVDSTTIELRGDLAEDDLTRELDMSLVLRN